MRELTSNILCFNIGKSQLEKIFDEAIQIDKDKYQQLIDVCFKNEHDWILINLHKSRTIYKMFGRVIISNECI